VLESVVDFLVSVLLILCKLSQGVCLNALDLCPLAFQLCVEFVHQFCLHLHPLRLLSVDCILNLLRVCLQIVQNLLFCGHSVISLLPVLFKILIHLSANNRQLVSQGLNAVCTLISTLFLQELHPVVTSLDLSILIVGLSSELLIKFFMQILHLLLVFNLKRFQLLIYFLAFVNCILLSVFYFPKAFQKKALTGRHL